MLNKISNFYIPARVFVSASALEYSRTEEIISRIKKCNPKVEIINISNNKPLRPNLKGRALYDYVKETIVLCTRSANYMSVFGSPGQVSENLGIVGNLHYHCPLRCTFCYLDVAGRGTPWNQVYVDLENFNEQAVKERLVYRITQTLWSSISAFQESSLNKVPKNFKIVCDQTIRKTVLIKRSEIKNDKEAVRYLKRNLKGFFTQLDIKLTQRKEAALKGIYRNIIWKIPNCPCP